MNTSKKEIVTNTETQDDSIWKRLEKDELTRVSIEKYSTKRIVFLAIIPSLLLSFFILYWLYISVTDGQAHVFIEYIGPYLVIPTIIGSIVSRLIDDWEDRLTVKNNLEKQGKLKYSMDYDDDHIYTDSQLYYVLYNFAKIIFLGVNIFVLGYVIMLFFKLI